LVPASAAPTACKNCVPVGDDVFAWPFETGHDHAGAGFFDSASARDFAEAVDVNNARHHNAGDL